MNSSPPPSSLVWTLLPLLVLSFAAPVLAQSPKVNAGPILDLADLMDPLNPFVTIPSPYVYLGSSVAMDGDYAIICGLRPGGNGLAYLYSKSVFGWVRESRLDEAAAPADLIGFGAKVAMGGGTAAILQRGASRQTTAVHVFGADFGYGLETSITSAAWPVANVTSIAVHGDTLVMGDDKAADTRTGIGSGRVAVFVRSPTGWKLQAHLSAADPVSALRFGASVAVDRDRIAVGAPGARVDAEARRGACYIFERREGVWRQTARLADPNGASYEDLGTNVSLSGNTVLASSPGRTYSAAKGAVSAFQRQSVGTWQYEGLLPVPRADSNAAAPVPQLFGSRLSLSGSLAAVGSATGSVGTERSYLYQRRGDRWQQLTPLDAPGDLSAPGSAAFVSGTNFLVGAPFENTDAGLRSGRVRTYEVTTGLGVFDGPSVASPEITSDGVIEVNLGDIVVGRKVTRSITLQNLSATLLEGVSITSDGIDGESLVIPPITELAVGASTTLHLSVTPPLSGIWQTRIYVDGYGGTYSQRVLRVNANVLESPEPPFIVIGPRSQLVWDEAPVDFVVDAGGTESLGFQWTKDGKTLPGATTRQLNIRTAGAANAGTYKVKVSNSSGSAESLEASLAVYDRKADTALRVNDGAEFTLEAPVVGPGVVFKWFRNSVALVEGGAYSGTAAKVLRVSAATPALAGQFSVVVNPGAAQVTPQKWNVTVLQRPSITNGANFLAQLNVARGVTERISTTPTATRYTFKNLPPGIVGDQYYGTISGKPTRPGLYQVSVVASNAAGLSEERVFPMQVGGVDLRSVGDYRGTISRQDVNEQLGGQVQFSTSATGACTGVLQSGRRTVRFTTSLFQSLDAASYFAEVDASTTTSVEKYELVITVATGRLQGKLSTDSIPVPINVVNGWVNPWSALNPSSQWTDYCTVAISPRNVVTDFSSIPGGSSYTTLGIDTMGRVTWAGRMADGAVTVYSTTLSPTLINRDASDAVEMPVFIPLNSGSGSLLGSLQLNQSNTSSGSYHNITGAMDWFGMAAAPSSRTRNYKTGIARHDLVAVGGWYAAPSPGLPVLGLNLVPLNARLNIAGAGFEAAAQASLVVPPFTLTGAAKAVMPSPNAVTRSLTVDRTKGTFSGAFKLTDANLINPAKKEVRSVKFYGVLVTASRTGSGFVALPARPDIFVSPPTTTLTSPIRSARLTLAPTNP